MLNRCVIGCLYGFSSIILISGLASAAPVTLIRQPLDPNETSTAAPVNSGVLARNASAITIADAVGQLSAADRPGAVNQLSPEEFGRFTSITAFNNASFETQGMDNYLASLRSGPNGTFTGGTGTLDTTGFFTNDTSRLLAWNPPASTGLISDVVDPLMGGMDMKDAKSIPTRENDSRHPWNFFVRGNVVLDQGLSQIDVSHFDGNTESVTVGADYRLSPNFLFGLTAAYAHTDVTLDQSNSSATIDSYSPGLYASYADHGWYANAVGTYLHNEYTQDRSIAFLGENARSATGGNEGVADLDGGYDFHRGGFVFGPLAGLQYTHLTVDGYNENGSTADLSVNGQESDSLRSRLGGHFAYSFRWEQMIFSPHISASWQHEFMDQSRGITSSFTNISGNNFSVRTENPERDFALADVGITAGCSQTVSVFTDYLVQAGQSNYFGQSIQAGVKIGF